MIALFIKYFGGVEVGGEVFEVFQGTEGWIPS